jgi:molecular chaperone GrpE
MINDNEPRPSDAAGAAGASAADGTNDPLAKAQGDAQKYLDNWRRAEADFQNYKKRAEQERDESRRYAGVSVVINLLPIVDDLERALGSVDSHLSALTWVDGIRLIYRKLIALLDNAGVKAIAAEGQAFDPRFHEAVAEVEGEEGKVLSEVQRGYMLHDRVLRPAMVVVGKGSKNEQGTANTEQGGPA